MRWLPCHIWYGTPMSSRRTVASIRFREPVSRSMGISEREVLEENSHCFLSNELCSIFRYVTILNPWVSLERRNECQFPAHDVWQATSDQKFWGPTMFPWNRSYQSVKATTSLDDEWSHYSPLCLPDSVLRLYSPSWPHSAIAFQSELSQNRVRTDVPRIWWCPVRQ